MPQMTEIICACGCGKKKRVRTADVKRGWGKYYSKSCKAKAQERRTKQFAAYIQQQRYNDDEDTFEVGHIFEAGYWGHGQQ